MSPKLTAFPRFDARSPIHAERLQLTQFSDLGLAEVLLRALTHEGYTTPTPIQAKAIPPVLTGRDLLGIAQTGTGKTAAFALPIINRLLADRRRATPRHVRALVLAPTRELATQIADSFDAYGRFAKISVAVVIGGVGMGGQVKAMSQGLDVLVATPGRLLDHMQQGNVKLAETEVVVLDEADHMLDLGFIVPIRQIVAKIPKARQSLFFSATMPREIASLAADMLRDPIQVAVAPVATTAERVRQEVIFCDTAAKRDVLAGLIAKPEFTRTLVFTRTKRGADRVTEHLEKHGVSAAAIHGNKSQNQRQRALDQFRAGRTRVLVATDIAARGIDVDNVTHVVNYELPDVPEAYVHRIGRTARAGAEGIAVSFCDNSERPLLRAIEKLTRQSLPVTDMRGAAGPKPSAAPVAEDRRDQRGPRQQRPAARPQQDARSPRAGEARPHRNGEARPARTGEGRPALWENRPAHSDNRPARSENRPQGGRPPQGERPHAAPGAPRSAGKPFRSQRPRPQNAGAGAPRA
jgi:ATP-dependent RNA helicase RhlE